MNELAFAGVLSAFVYKMQFEYDPERLIEEVRKRPGIWDYEHANYRSKAMRSSLWNEIVTELMQTNTKLSKSEKRELEIQLQKKWKSIRDCFQKYLAKPNRTKRPYLYSKHLRFLLKDSDAPLNAEAITGVSDSEEEAKKKKVWRPRKKLKLEKDEEQTSEEDNRDVDNGDEYKEDSNDGALEINISQMNVSKENRTHTDEFAFASVDSHVKTDVDDPDRLFLLSLLPHLKTVPEEYRLNAKMDMMQVLRNANYSSTREHKII